VSFQLFVLPVLSLAAGLVALFTSPEKLKNRWLLAALLSVLILTCGFDIYFRHSDSKEKAADKARSEARIAELSQTLGSFRAEARTQLTDIATLLRAFGWPADKVPTVQAAQQSFAAARARAELAPASAAAQRKTITVEYFPKDVDRRIVEGALRELGFTVVPGRTVVADVPTNAIWFGAEVSLDDVRLVAYTLMRAGVGIKGIRPFTSSTPSISRLIQVGADTAYVSRPNITVEQVRSAKSFSR
jgi:hypothetical protein